MIGSSGRRLSACWPYRKCCHGAFPAGDAFSVYPGADGPVSSVGLELFLEALQDMRVLELLETRVGREETERLYQDIDYRDFAKSAHRPEEVLTLRKRVDERLMECL